MTEKLYYLDSSLTDFSANVLSCQPDKDRWTVTLDRSAFYPEGGGQPADHGSLDAANVLDVHEHDGVILHYCDQPLPVGKTVQGHVDWDRRFDFMQQHSGEHIVSGILCATFHCQNTGFHIGHDLVTIDFNTTLDSESLFSIEAAANRYVWENHPVSISWPTPDALDKLAYRSKKALSGPVRIVSFPGADCCACCGTHVSASGQVGFIKLFSCQKFRDGVRIQMAAGQRALHFVNLCLEQNTSVSQLLSAKPTATAPAVQHLQDQIFALQGRINDLESADFAHKAQHFANQGNVLLFENDLSPDSLRKLCAAVAQTCQGRCAVFAGAAPHFKYAVAQPGGSLRALAKDLNLALHGRGGGKDDFIQGSVHATKDEIQHFFNTLP